MNLYSTVNQRDLIDIKIMFYQTTAEYTFFSRVKYGTFSRIHHMLGKKSWQIQQD